MELAHTIGRQRVEQPTPEALDPRAVSRIAELNATIQQLHVELGERQCEIAALRTQAEANQHSIEQAQRAAVHQERQRLAHDLHDTVTHALFSASLIAQALPHTWQHNQAEGVQHLEDLRLLTRGALAEMRALLLELRPAALDHVHLGALLQQLADAMAGRMRAPIALTIEDRRHVPNVPLAPQLQITLYRVAQEALNNSSKHANAQRVSLHAQLCPTQVELCISDDGRGFDLANCAADGFGLDIMRERVAAIGGCLSIASRLGHGTTITVRWNE